MQARANLENYVFGTAVSTVPPVVPPMLPRGAANVPAYPYVSSPGQWNQGVAPISMAAAGADMLCYREFFDRVIKSQRRLQDFF
jgi:hypothetical protein